jgi:hypothetical protein
VPPEGALEHMSLRGAVTRRYTFLDMQFTRQLSESELELVSGWQFGMTIGPIEFGLDKLRAKGKLFDKPTFIGTSPGFEVFYGGYCLSICDSGETFERRYEGDAEALHEDNVRITT